MRVVRVGRMRVVLSLVAVLLARGTVDAENWPGWRGPRGDGTSGEERVPTSWDGPAGQAIAWKVKVPGKGHASPIVWERRVFVVTCDEQRRTRILICHDRDTGKRLWSRDVVTSPLEKKHKLNSFASGTPVTDGRRIYLSFLEADSASLTKPTPGNLLVAAYDLDGNREWLARPGRFSSVHGFCSSPVLYKNLVIVNGDHDGDAYIVALNRTNGRTVWLHPRLNKTRSYVTPIIREIDGRSQMILSGSKSIVSLDPNNGNRHWIIDGPTEQYVASLVYNGKLLFMTAGFPEHHIMAIRPDGEGNVTDTHVVWHTTRGCSYVPSPIVEGRHFLVAADNGIASCFDAASGDRHWMERLGPHYSASLISASGLVYFTDDDGVTKIVRPGAKLDVVAVNQLGENCYASPAVSENHLFIRGAQSLFCIGPGWKQ